MDLQEGPETEVPMLWSRIPAIAIVSYTSNSPQDNLGNYLVRYIIPFRMSFCPSPCSRVLKVIPVLDAFGSAVLFKRCEMSSLAKRACHRLCCFCFSFAFAASSAAFAAPSAATAAAQASLSHS